ncbi:MAG: hypothetical protein ACOY0T_33530 [Myxococcota bacterium]
MKKTIASGLLAILGAVTACGAPASNAEETGSIEQAATHTWTKIPLSFGALGDRPVVVRNACGLNVSIATQSTSSCIRATTGRSGIRRTWEGT